MVKRINLNEVLKDKEQHISIIADSSKRLTKTGTDTTNVDKSSNIKEEEVSLPFPKDESKALAINKVDQLISSVTMNDSDDVNIIKSKAEVKRSISVSDAACNEKKQELNGVYLIKNELRIIKPGDSLNDINDFSLSKTEPPSIPNKNSPSKLNELRKIHKSQILKDSECNTEVKLIKKFNEIEKVPKLNNVSIDGKDLKPPSMNDCFKRIINIDEEFKGSKFKNYFKKYFSPIQNDEALTIQKLNTENTNMSIEMTPHSRNPSNSKPKPKLLKSIDSADKLKKLKVRVINREKEEEKTGEKTNISISNDHNEQRNNDGQNGKLNKLAKPPTPKKIKLSVVPLRKIDVKKPDNLPNPLRNSRDSVMIRNSSTHTIVSNQSNTSCEKFKTIDESFSTLKNHLTEVKLADRNSMEKSVSDQSGLNVKAKSVLKDSLEASSKTKKLKKNKILAPSPKIIKNHPKVKGFFQNITGKK